MAGPKCDDCSSDMYKSTATLGAGACTVGCKSIAPRGLWFRSLKKVRKLVQWLGHHQRVHDPQDQTRVLSAFLIQLIEAKQWISRFMLSWATVNGRLSNVLLAPPGSILALDLPGEESFLQGRHTHTRER